MRAPALTEEVGLKHFLTCRSAAQHTIVLPSVSHCRKSTLYCTSLLVRETSFYLQEAKMKCETFFALRLGFGMQRHLFKKMIHGLVLPRNVKKNSSQFTGLFRQVLKQ